MKVVFCYFCGDVYTPRPGQKNGCFCGRSSATATSAERVDQCLKVTVTGTGIPIALDSNHLMTATRVWRYDRRTSFISGHSIDTTQEHNDVIYREEPDESK